MPEMKVPFYGHVRQIDSIKKELDAAMAATSLQALMRHQNHRRMKTLPVPAPSAMSSVQAPAIVSW